MFEVTPFVVSVTDNLGFSSANLDAVHTIFINVIRSGESTPFERTLFTGGLIGRGNDLSFSQSPIQPATPFTLSLTPRDAFLKGEQIQVLAGAAVALQIHLDDMNGFISAVTLWEVTKLSIGVRSSREQSSGQPAGSAALCGNTPGPSRHTRCAASRAPLTPLVCCPAGQRRPISISARDEARSQSDLVASRLTFGRRAEET